MKNHYKILIKLVQCLILMAGFSSHLVLAEDEVIVENQDYGEVIVESSASFSDAYKTRRADAGAYFSLTSESLSFPQYVSTLDNSVYTDRYGNLSMIGFQVQRKLNWSPMSFAYGFGYSQGSAQGSGEATMTLTKLELNARVTLDGWLNEPKYVPFVFAEAWQMEISEKDPTTSFSARVEGIGFHYGAGISFQLNRLDLSTAYDAYAEYGLENTYLDVYLSMNTAPQDEAAPDVSTDLAAGFGITLEF